MSRNRKILPLIFNAYKPVGPSSSQAVHQFKRNLNYDYGKIGHFGTLDPFAEGVLLIGVQGAQRLNNFIHEYMPKTYRAVGLFGAKTNSGDHTGEVMESGEIKEEFQQMSKEEMEGLLRSEFLGEYWQAPHMVSATKYNGRRLYDLARAGKVVGDIDKKKREILELKIHDYNYPHLDFEVTVSSGTYIRSLFEEIAVLFGGHGHLLKLQRTKIGTFSMENSIPRESWPTKEGEFDLEKFGVAIDEAFYLNKVFLNIEQTKTYIYGLTPDMSEIEIQQNLDNPFVYSNELVWVYSDGDLLIGMAKIVDGHLVCVFNLNFYVLGLQTR